MKSGNVDVLELVRLHLELEGKGLDEAGQLIRIPCPDPDTLHRVYVIRHARGDTLFFNTQLPQSLRARLMALPVSDFFSHPERVTAILAEDKPCEEMHIGRSYVFPSQPAALSPDLYPDVVRLSQVDPEIVQRFDPNLDLSRIEIFGVLVDGQLVSACQSARENERAGEAWVWTLEPYRRRGYARQATAAWGHWLQEHGKVPFYSHKWENYASQAVAKSLKLIQYIADAGYA